jgi:hypothetical protein
MTLVYTVWFRSPRFPQDDPDHEWPACFVINGESAEHAQPWGDMLAKRYAERTGEIFLWSEIEAVADPLPANVLELPIVHQGVDASDQHIGW